MRAADRMLLRCNMQCEPTSMIDATFVPATSSKPALMDISAGETRRQQLDSQLTVITKEACRAPRLDTGTVRLSRDEQVHLAALLTFCDPLPQDCPKLQALSLR